MTIPTPAVLMPYVDGLMLEMIRPALPDVQVVTVYAPAELRVYPVAQVRRVAGGRTHNRLLDNPTIGIDVFAKDRRVAERTCEQVLQVLVYADENQVVSPDGEGGFGHISNVDVQLGPSELRELEQPADIYRFTALVELQVRPN